MSDVRCQRRSGAGERKVARNGPRPGGPSATFSEAGLSIWSVRLSPETGHGDQGFAARARSTGRPLRAHGGPLPGRGIQRHRAIRQLAYPRNPSNPPARQLRNQLLHSGEAADRRRHDRARVHSACLRSRYHHARSREAAETSPGEQGHEAVKACAGLCASRNRFIEGKLCSLWPVFGGRLRAGRCALGPRIRQWWA